MKNKWIFLLLTIPLWTFAQSEKGNPDDWHGASGTRVVNGTNVKMLGIGVGNILDTYISPEKYKGLDLRYISMTDRQSNRHKHISYRTVHQGEFNYTHNRADNNNELGGLYNFQYAVHYNWSLFSNQLQVHAGGGIDASLGFLYNTRNGNNPAQLRLGLNIAPSASASYDFTAFRKRFTVDYGVQVPLLGVMFTPHYGQSYYEIFTRGNYDHNVVLSHPFNTPSMRHALTLQLHLKKVSLRLGYLGDYQQADVNNLKYHNYSHLVVFGITRRFHIVNH